MSKELRLPEVGEGIDAGTVVSVLVKEGDRVDVDQPVLELETDKAVVEVPSTVAGVVRSVHVAANQEAKVGDVIITVDEGAGTADAAGADAAAGGDDAGSAEATEDRRAGEEPDGGVPVAPGADAAEDDAPDRVGADREGTGRRPDAGTGSGRDGGGDGAGAAPRETRSGARPPPPGPGGRTLIPAAPSVRRVAREQGIDIAQVPGTGHLGRISADDVHRFAAGGPGAAAAPAAPAAQPELPDFSRWGEVERRPMSGIRKATVRAMTQAWSTIPMVTHFDSADATEFEALRARHRKAAEAAGVKLTPTAILIKIVAAALRRFPDFNASIDVRAQEIVHKSFVNVGVAVDTEHGLLVPVLKDADRKNVFELAGELGDLAERARNRKLTPDDMSGGTFSVSNLGGIGGHGFTPIVNPPEVAILGVSRSSVQPVWNDEEGAFEPRLTMPLALSYDHRLIDGASAARFLRWVCAAVEDPFLLALE